MSTEALVVRGRSGAQGTKARRANLAVRKRVRRRRATSSVRLYASCGAAPARHCRCAAVRHKAWYSISAGARLGSAVKASRSALPSPGGRLQAPDWLRIALSGVPGGSPRRSGRSWLNVVPSCRCAPYSLSRRSPAPSRHAARLLRGCFSQPPSSAAQGGGGKNVGV